MNRSTTERLRYGVANLLALAFGVLKSRILAASFGPSGIGLYSQLASLVQTTCSIVLLGTTSGSMREIASAGSDSNEAEYRETLRAAWFLAVVLGGAGTVAMIVGSPWIAAASLQAPEQWGVVCAVAPCIALYALSGYFSATMEGNREFNRLGDSKVLISVVGVGGASLASRLAPEAGIPAAIVAFYLGTLLVTSWKSGHSREPWLATRSPHRTAAIQKIIKTGLATMAAGGAIPLSDLACRSMYLEYASIEWMGLAASALALFSLTFSVTWLCSGPTLVPDIARISQDPVKVNRYLINALSIAIPTSLASAGVLCASSTLLLQLAYGKNFTEAAHILKALAALIPLRVCFDCLRFTHLALGARRVYGGCCLGMAALQAATFYASLEVLGDMAFPCSIAVACIGGSLACLYFLNLKGTRIATIVQLAIGTSGSALLSMLIHWGFLDDLLPCLSFSIPATVWAIRAQLRNPRGQP